MKNTVLSLIATTLLLVGIAFHPVNGQDIRRGFSVITKLTLTGNGSTTPLNISGTDSTGNSITLTSGAAGGAVSFGNGGAGIATTGLIRATNNVNLLNARNAANNGDLAFLFLDASNVWQVANSGNAAAVFGGALTSKFATGGVGYSTGAGGTITQATSKATGVTLNTATGAITMNAAALTTATSVGFTVTNSAVAATDSILVNIKSGATVDSYLVTVDTVAAGSFRISLRNINAGTLSEAVVLSFAVIKGATS